MRKRFMEGWYYRITLPEENVSFAFIFSIEDPGRYDKSQKSDLALAAVQVMGPDDEYVVQSDRDDSKFWAWENSQTLGCTFEWEDDDDNGHYVNPQMWNKRVKTGFQVLPDRLQGKVQGHDGSLGGVNPGQGIAKSCEFDMTIKPLSGWGDDDFDSVDKQTNKQVKSRAKQRSTAGWLASFSVFEPHWQVTMADGRATGSTTWNGKCYEFENVPFYAEKNWGGAFPSKWYWAQCNAFEGYDRLSVTTGGGTRNIPLGRTEDLGLICVHYDGVFYEAVPWTGDMSWDVDPWGKWIMSGKCTSGERLFEVEFTAICDPNSVPGVVLRAPTKDNGLSYFCRDSFYAETKLSLWTLSWNKKTKKYERVSGPPIIDNATSKHGAVEIGGGPWWDTWKGSSKMKQPLKGLVQVPYLVAK